MAFFICWILYVLKLWALFWYLGLEILLFQLLIIFILASPGKPAPSGVDELGRDRSMFTENAKQRRAAEREGRRSRRRQRREKLQQSSPHHDGMSTDDEEMETDAVKFRTDTGGGGGGVGSVLLGFLAATVTPSCCIMVLIWSTVCSTDKILMEAKNVFEDVMEDFTSIGIVKKRFEEWKLVYGDCYKQAYISLCLPKLFVPFVKLEMLDWNPFQVHVMGEVGSDMYLTFPVHPCYHCLKLIA